MKNKNTIAIITHTGVLAATLVVARFFVITYLKSGTPLGKLLGAPKELQFYVIPAATIYLINKFGRKDGFFVALSGAMIGVIAAGFTGTYSFYVSPISIAFDYMIPWALCTTIAFVSLDSKIKQAITSIIVWTLIMMSWAVSGVFAWGVKPYSTALKWGIVTFNGWMMWIILPVLVIILCSKFKNIK